MGKVATLSGTMLTPGVSLNNRLYSRGVIGKAVTRMQERLSSPDGLPIVMRTHHEAGDDTRQIVGKITSVSLDENGNARYTAKMTGSSAAEDIAALTSGKDPSLRSVSIHGYWLGPVKRVEHAGKTVETAEDLEIDAVDFTAFPGVTGAVLDAPLLALESVTEGRTPISESVDARVAITEEAPVWSERRGVQYEGDAAEAKYSADDMKAMLAKGHAMKNPSGDASYPIKDKADLAKAVKAVGRGKADHGKIRKHIIARAKALGAMDMIPDNWNSDGSTKESGTRLSEIREYWPDGPENPSGFCIDAYCGPLSVTVRGSVPTEDLRAAALAATAAAMDALCVMDHDGDADIDVGMDGETAMDSTDDQMDGTSKESAQTGGTVTETVALEQPAPVTVPPGTATVPGEIVMKVGGLPFGEADVARMINDRLVELGYRKPDDETTTETAQVPENTTEKESAVSETTEPTVAADAAPARMLTEADMTALGETIGNALAEALRAVAETTTPKHAAATATETTETAEEVPAEVVTEKAGTDLSALKESLAKELRKELRDELRAEFLEEKGLPPRRGYRLTENADEEKLTDAELFNQHRVDILLGQFARTPSA